MDIGLCEASVKLLAVVQLFLQTNHSSTFCNLWSSISLFRL